MTAPGAPRAVGATAFTITCGITHVLPVAEQIVKTLRESEGLRTDGGCGKPFDLSNPFHLAQLYRCVECERFLCKPCILEHFRETGDHIAAARTAAARRGGRAVSGAVVDPDPDTRWHDAIEARSDHSRGCRDGCPLTPCAAGQQVNDAEWAAYLEARGAWDVQHAPRTGALLLAFLAGIALLGVYTVGDVVIRSYGPRLSAAWGG